MKQTDEQKLERSAEILRELKEARGGKLLYSHRVMGKDPNLVNMFLQQYVNCNKKDISIPKKYRELIVMAIGMATGTETFIPYSFSHPFSQFGPLIFFIFIHIIKNMDKQIDQEVR